MLNGFRWRARRVIAALRDHGVVRVDHGQDAGEHGYLLAAPMS
jgi:hypothetical protein